MNPQTKAEFGRGLLAAWLTAKGDPKGALLVSGSFAECKRSFFAALVALPGMLALISFKLDALENMDGLRYLVVELISYVMGWSAFPLVAFGVSRQIGRLHLWARYITVYNWASVIILAVTIPVTLLINSPSFANALGGTLSLMTLVMIIGYEWRLARLVLQASPWQTGFLIALDLLLSFAIESMSHTLALGNAL
ncbi:MAG: hypothetical protein HQL44_13225 [Alphaproteobacteria bacterium]|nr:hypothetical protein [Alphaproteobacteria bacterium]